ncbi:hypothetical protein [Nostoc sp.]|uniref:hypothetical protein n=1 Tax=Nostoc sp. TaxID=1180 RepID=UPI002FFBE64B
MASYALLGEDAQEWVSRTRREADEHRKECQEIAENFPQFLLKSYMVRQVYLVENLWKNLANFPQGNYT